MMSSPLTRAAALAACAAGLIFSGCLSGNTAADAARPGQIKLVSMNGLAKAAVTASGAASFTLDTAKTSFQQYFILQNTGDEPITDIELTTDNPNFVFSPSRIAVLPPSEGSSVIQVIKLNILHGKQLDAVGLAPFLTPGPVSVSGLITGTTEDGGSEVSVSENLTLNTFAKLARVELGISDSSLRTLDQLPFGQFMSAMLGSPFRMYYLKLDSTGGHTAADLRLKNTGNVALTIERRGAEAPFAIVDSLVLLPESSFVFKSNIFRVDAHGTTFAPSGSPVGEDGKVLFSAHLDL